MMAPSTSSVTSLPTSLPIIAPSVPDEGAGKPDNSDIPVLRTGPMKRMQVLGCVWATAAVAFGCGGSSSETPFPQAPIERGLDERHEAVFVAEQAADSAAPATGVSSSVSPKPVADERPGGGRPTPSSTGSSSPPSAPGNTVP